MITVNDLKGTPTNLVLHARLSGGSLFVYRSVKYPALQISMLRRGKKHTKTFSVEGHEVDTIEEAVDLLNQHEAGALEPAPQEENDG